MREELDSVELSLWEVYVSTTFFVFCYIKLPDFSSKWLHARTHWSISETFMLSKFGRSPRELSWVMQQFKYWSSKLPVIMPICKTEPKLKAQNERFYWVDFSNRGFSCIKQPLFSGRQRTPSLVLEVILTPTYSRKEVIVERYRSCKLSEEVKYDTQGKTLLPSGLLAAILSPQMAASRRITLPQPVNSPVVLVFVWQTQGTWESCGRPVCESGAETSNWRGPTVSLSPMN